MTDFISNPEQLKAVIKDKWLDYYEANQGWLQEAMKTNSAWKVDLKLNKDEFEKLQLDYTPYRPQCTFILGVISALEPKVQGLLSFMAMANSTPVYLVKGLDLDFVPELELKKRAQKITQQQKDTSDDQYLAEIRKDLVAKT